MVERDLFGNDIVEDGKKERLNEAYNYLVFKKMVKNKRALAKEMCSTAPNVSNALNGKEGYLTERFIKRFHSLFSDTLSLDWLLTGKGEMLSTEATKSNNVQTNDGNGNTNVIGDNNNVGNNNITITRARTYNNTDDAVTDDVKPIVPKYLAAKQDTDVYEVIKKGQISNLTTMKVIPPYVDFDFYYQVRQDAMTPDYKQGDVLALKHIKGDDNDIIQGAAMVIDTTDYGFLLRRLYDRGEYYECKRINENSAFENQNVYKNKVIRLYRVVYSVRLGD